MTRLTSDRPDNSCDALPPARMESLRGLKVALFTGNYNYLKEGANQALNKLVAHLEHRIGATVRVYSPVTATPAFEPRGTLVPVGSVPLPGRPEFRLALGLPRAIRADIRAFAPDIVHVATPDILGSRAVTFAGACGIPIVASVHTRFETYPAYYGLGWLRGLVEWHLDRFYGRSDMILTPTPSIAAEMEATHPSAKLRVWTRGVDAGLFTPDRRSLAWRRAQGIGDNEVALAFFGRLVLEKGIDRFAETVQTLRNRGRPVRAVIIGEGPARGRLRAMLPDAVFTGHLTGTALATAIASTDILINPSLTETFGNVTLEAMACGVAVVAADVASTTNLVTDGVSALVSTPDTPGYVGQVDRLIADPVLRSSLALAARATALGWRWEQVLDAVVESYAVLLERRRSDSGSRKTIS